MAGSPIMRLSFLKFTHLNATVNTLMALKNACGGWVSQLSLASQENLWRTCCLLCLSKRYLPNSLTVLFWRWWSLATHVYIWLWNTGTETKPHPDTSPCPDSQGTVGLGKSSSPNLNPSHNCSSGLPMEVGELPTPPLQMLLGRVS